MEALTGLRLTAADFEVQTVIGRGHFGEVRSGGNLAPPPPPPPLPRVEGSRHNALNPKTAYCGPIRLLGSNHVTVFQQCDWFTADMILLGFIILLSLQLLLHAVGVTSHHSEMNVDCVLRASSYPSGPGCAREEYGRCVRYEGHEEITHSSTS